VKTLTKIFLTGSIVLSSLFANAQKFELNDKGFPTTKGIIEYAKYQEKTKEAINEFNKKFNFNSEEAKIIPTNLIDYLDEENYSFEELGLYFYGDREILIEKNEVYYGYSLKELNTELRQRLIEGGDFLKGTIMHEFGHYAVCQIAENLKSTKIKPLEYYSPRPFSMKKETFGSKFIEEGIAEYCSWKMNEVLFGKTPYVPKNLEELLDTSNVRDIYYEYSVYYLKDFLDNLGFKTGVEILITNEPPTKDEILHPEKYFSRLKFGELRFNFAKYAGKTLKPRWE